jgi:hypothetical protein
VIAALTVPWLLPASVSVALSLPSDQCSSDKLRAVQEWENSGRVGPAPADCVRERT